MLEREQTEVAPQGEEEVHRPTHQLVTVQNELFVSPRHPRLAPRELVTAKIWASCHCAGDARHPNVAWIDASLSNSIMEYRALCQHVESVPELDVPRLDARDSVPHHGNRRACTTTHGLKEVHT